MSMFKVYDQIHMAFPPYGNRDPFSIRRHPPHPASKDVLFQKYLENRERVLATIPELFSSLEDKWHMRKSVHHVISCFVDEFCQDHLSRQRFSANPVHVGNVVEDKKNEWRYKCGDSRGGVLVGKAPMILCGSGYA